MTELQRACQWDALAGQTKAKRGLYDKEPTLYASLIQEEWQEFVDAYSANDLVETLDACGDMLKVIAGFVNSIGYCPEELLRIVNDSNFTKFTTDELVAQQTVDLYNSQERYSDVHYIKRGDYYIVRGHDKLGAEEPKVLKQMYCTSPKIKEMVDE